MSCPIPLREKERIKVLNEALILDSFDEESYDRYTNMAARIFKAPIALVSLVDTDRQWFKSRVGLEVTETHRDAAFCAHAVMEDAPSVFIVRDALNDPRFCQNPLVLGFPFIRFYAGACLEVDEERLGTLCVIDTKARGEDSFGDKEREILKDLAKIVANLIIQRRKENLTNIYQTLQLNGEIMQLLRIPLNHIEQSKQIVSSLFHQLSDKEETKSSKKVFRRLVEEVQTFSKEVNRLMPIAALFTRLLMEMYKLEHYDSLVDLPTLSSPSVQEGSAKESEFALYSSLTKMNVEAIQLQLEEFYQISFDSCLMHFITRSSTQQLSGGGVTVDWLGEEPYKILSTATVDCYEDDSAAVNSNRLPTTEKPTFPVMLYSYPAFMQLLIMLLYDIFDYHGHNARITVQFQHTEKLEGSSVHGGMWKIIVEDDGWRRDSSRQKRWNIEDLLSFFSAITKFSNCSHRVVHNGPETHMSEDQDTNKNVLPSYYEVMIPVYDFSSCEPAEDESRCSEEKALLRDPSPTSVVGMLNLENPNLRVESDPHGEDEFISTQEKRKPSREPSSSSTSSNVLLYPFRFVKTQWKQYATLVAVTKNRKKVHLATGHEK